VVVADALVHREVSSKKERWKILRSPSKKVAQKTAIFWVGRAPPKKGVRGGDGTFEGGDF